MRYAGICTIVLLIAAGVSAEEYVVGGYYAPYGVCTSVETTSVESVSGVPYGYDETVTTDHPSYYSRPYYPKSVEYVRPTYSRDSRYYYPTRYYHCWPWRSRYGNWRDRRDYRRWCRDMRRCLSRSCD